MQSREYLEILRTIGDAFNSPVGTRELLERTARAVSEQLRLKACQFRLLSQDQQLLDPLASHGLSERFLERGPVEAGPSVADALAGKPLLIPDCRSDERVPFRDAHAEEGLVTCLTVPLRTRGQVIGVLQAYAGEPRTFSDTDLKLMEVVAAFSARAVASAMFHQVLDNVSAAIRSSLSLDAALDSVVRAICEDLRLKGCTVHLLDAEDRELRQRAEFGLSKKFLAHLKTDPPSGFAEAMQGRATQILDPRQDPPSLFLSRVIEEGVSSVLYVPLMIRAKAVGVLTLFTHQPYPFSDDERYFMKAIADECGLAIQQSRMHAIVRQSYQTLVNEFQIWFESGYRQM